VNQTQVDTRALEALYREVAGQYDKIDDFRAKLLSYLPLATALVSLLTQPKGNPEYIAAIAVFGAVATIGLFVHELTGIIHCYGLIVIDRALDDKLTKKADVKFGPFSSRVAFEETKSKANTHVGPFSTFFLSRGWYVGRESAACIVYSATITLWTVLAALPMHNVSLMAAVAVVVFIGTALIAKRVLDRNFRLVEEAFAEKTAT
jgi:hypothetical protein